MDKKIIQKAGKYFTETEKHQVIQELLEHQLTKQEIWEKYTGQEEEHGQLLRWMKALGYNTGIKTRRPNIVSNLYHTMPKKKKPENSNDNEGESFENLQLKKRIAGLEKQLKDAELKAIAFSTMVDIAEKEFNIQLYETSSFVFLFCRFQRQFNNSSIFIHPKYFVFSAFQIVNHGTFYLQ